MQDGDFGVYHSTQSKLAARSFASTQEAVGAILNLVAERLSVRSSFLARIAAAEGRAEVLAAYNAPGGCDIRPGDILEVPELFRGIDVGSAEASPLLVEDAQSEPASVQHPPAKALPNSGSSRAVPLRLSDGAFFGVLGAVDPEPRVFRPDQVDLLVMLARLVATQIERDQELTEMRRSEEDLRKKAERFQQLVEHARDIIFCYRLVPCHV